MGSASSSTKKPNKSPNKSQSGPSSMRLNPWAQIEELEEVFKRFDIDGDGKISWWEAGKIMGSLGKSTATKEELKKMLSEVDSDGDGFIDLDEFIELNTRGPVVSANLEEDLMNAFKAIDVDRNGPEELQKVLKSLGEPSSLQDCKEMWRSYFV